MNFSFFNQQKKSYTGTASVDEDEVFYVNPYDENGNWVGLRYGDLAYLSNYHLNKLYKRYKKAYRIYKGKHDILFQPKKPDFKPDNHIVMNYPKKMVKSYNGYFDGIAPSIDLRAQPSDDAQEQATIKLIDEKLNDFNKLNDTPHQINNISKWVDIYGRAYSLSYQGKDGLSYYKAIKPKDGFVIYSDDIENKPLFGVYYEDVSNKDEIICDVYGLDENGHNMTASGIKISQATDYNSPIEFEIDRLSFGGLPMIEWMAGDERMGIIEDQESIVNGIDSAISNKKNDADYFADSILWAKNMKIDKDEEKNLKDKHFFSSVNRVAGQEESDLKYLEKPNADTKEENLLNRLVFALYDISGIVDLNDKDFTNASSGEALKHRLQSMRQMADEKANYFTGSMMKLFGGFLTIHLSGEYINNLKIKFNINDPLDLLDQSTALVNLAKVNAAGLMSKKTILDKSNMVDDSDEELQQVAEEQKQEAGTIPTYSTDQQASEAKALNDSNLTPADQSSES